MLKLILSIKLIGLHAIVCASELPEWNLKQISTKPSLRSSAIKNGIIWVAGTKGSVHKSHDQGQNWIDVSLTNYNNSDIRDIHVFDNKTAIIMTVGSGNDSKLFKTMDAGKNWSLLYQNTDKTGFFDSIDFWNDNHGLLLGDPVDGYYVVKITQDGGKTWNRVGSKNLPIMLEKEVAFAASGNTLIVGKKGKAWFTTGGFSASLMSSYDYGQSWQRQSLPLYDKTQTAGGYSIALNNLDELFVIGGDYQKRDGQYNNAVKLKKTGDWINLESHNRGLRTAMSCVKQTCVMTGKLSSDISYDNGLSWQRFHSQGFYTLASEGNLMIAAGTAGKVSVINF
ncbi:MAG: WD40/YVTN/BNR-like repeat-containing protein [Marinicellaceae bacterium]